MDPTPGTPITSEDAAIIVEELVKDKDTTKDYLTRYYTNFVTQNLPGNEAAQNYFADVIKSPIQWSPDTK